MAQYQFLDELVKEFLLFRGFTNTLKAYDQELKIEKEKGFRVDRIVEQINQHINNFELTGLLELWRHFELRIFSKLDTSKAAAVKKLENSVFKLYVVNCIQHRQSDKLREFFEKLTPELQNQTEWKEWFALPYLRDPQDNPAFTIYFSRSWQDTMMLSLYNFFALCFQSLPHPRLADYRKTSARIKHLKDEIKSLKVRLAEAGTDYESTTASSSCFKSLEPLPPQEIMDDFFLIAQETEKTENQVISLKRFLKTITGQSDKKKQAPTHDSRSASRSRQPPTSLSVVKTPLKRVSNSSLKPEMTSVTATPSTSATSPSNTSTTAGGSGTSQQAGSSSEGGGAEESSTVVGPQEAVKKEQQGSDSLLATPAASATRYLLLGQEEYHEHRSAVSVIQVSCGGLIASADCSGVIKVWSPSPSSPPSTSATFISGSSVTSLSWIDHRRIIYGTNTGQIRLCDVEDKCLVLENSSQILDDDSVQVLVCSPTSTTFFVASKSQMKLVNTKSFVVEKNLSSLSSGVTVASYNHNGSLLLFGNLEGKVAILDLNREEILSMWSAHSTTVTCLSPCKDQTSVWTLSRDGILVRSSLIRPGEKLWSATLTPHGQIPPRFSLSSDGEHILTGSDSGGVVYKIGEEGSLTKILGLRGEHPLTAVCWVHGECARAITASLDGTVKIANLLSQ